MARLRLGPLLRQIDWETGERATVWVETDEPCTVEVRCVPVADAATGGAPQVAHTEPVREQLTAGAQPGGSTRTWRIAGHHYALVEVTGLRPGSVSAYEVLLDGERVWPLPDSRFPASTIRTPSPEQATARGQAAASATGGAPAVQIVFGSCRWAAPPGADAHDPVGPDALDTLAGHIAHTPDGERPDALVLLGDQVYADETSAATRAWLATRRDVSQPPWHQVADYEEYTRLYYESWLDPEVRWLLSTVPSCMMFDDHDVVDDWNTSAAWLAQMRATPWWRTRVLSGLMSYWVYQHLGNLSPAELAADELYAAVRAASTAQEQQENEQRERREKLQAQSATAEQASGAAPADEASAGPGTTVSSVSAAGGAAAEAPTGHSGLAHPTTAPDATAVLRDFVERSDADPTFARWSYRRDYGRVRLLMVDTRAARVLDEGARSMLDEKELTWLRDQAHAGQGEMDHLLIGTSLPWLLPHFVHDVEGWNAALCAGERGPRWARIAENVRQRADLEHWSAFPSSFDALTDLIAEAGRGPQAPATISVLSGDVHHAYVAEPDWSRWPLPPNSHVLQLTCSPVHNSIPASIRVGFRFGWSRAGRQLGRVFARHGRTGRAALGWRRTGGPWFGNQLMTLTLRGRDAKLRLDQARVDRSGAARLVTAMQRTVGPPRR
ncbi:DUF7800 domain-containing protein [Streptomyces zagrosensis]|uniref:Alkaline phosphatase n=1 Tax=Streptomyces zagrosensis TaxID=1042984 RepID=A0A7W9UVY6_9ACTN|nr:alkaline phosphatase D family protein [Streptomyces zagrosensis]MBB5933213.1 hypothetical protein [Streptomyces zagrosensis]